jgi:NRPS condensation-like uncharacterized protein
MTAEWMPVNPCDGCSHKNCILDADHCERLYIYRGKVKTAKAILEYLIEQCQVNYQKGILPPVVTRQELQQMKLELEKRQ